MPEDDSQSTLDRTSSSSASRLSLTDVFEKMRAEEMRDQEQYEKEKQKRKERWAEGRLSLSSGARLCPSTSQPRLPPPTSSEEAAPHRTTTSPPDSPPLHLVRKSRSFSSDYDTDEKGGGADRPAIGDRTVSEAELGKMVRLVKGVLEHPELDESRGMDDSSLTSILHLLEKDVARNASSDELAAALSMEVRLEKISMEDARYAERLNLLRERLGTLVTRRVPAPPHTSVKEETPTAPTGTAPPPHVRADLFSETIYSVLQAALVLFSIAWIWVRVAEYYADYLMMSTFYDPMYTPFYPLPAFASSFLSSSVLYNVPFATSSRHMIAPLGPGIE